MRYFCHHCHTQIAADELLPEFTCPQCHSGFIEEMPASRRTSNTDESQQPSSEDRVFMPSRLSSDEFSDDNSDVEFLDAYNGSLAQVFEFFQPQAHQQQQQQTPQQQQQQSDVDTDATDSNTTGQAPQTESSTSQQSDRQNRRVFRNPLRVSSNSHGLGPAVTYSTTNQSLADVLTDFISGVSFGTQYPDGGTTSSTPNVMNSSGPMGANRGLINIDFPLPFFLHSNPGDYAWGNAGFDAVITQLLNNLDGSNSGPPPMPKDQVENLPVVKIKDDQVKQTDLQCTVCMDDFEVGESARQLPCEHFFHQDCIIPWLNIHASCPICRKTFISGNAATSQVNATDPQNISITNVTQESINPNSNPTSTVTNTSLPSTTTASTTNRNPTGTAASSAAVSNQSSAPSYDYTEDDCD